MRIGMRKPSVKRMIKARTTGRAKRAVKRAVIPGYGKRGMGFVKNPKRAVKGAIYRRTTFSVWDLFRYWKSSSLAVTLNSGAFSSFGSS